MEDQRPRSLGKRVAPAGRQKRVLQNSYARPARDVESLLHQEEPESDRPPTNEGWRAARGNTERNFRVGAILGSSFCARRRQWFKKRLQVFSSNRTRAAEH